MIARVKSIVVLIVVRNCAGHGASVITSHTTLLWRRGRLSSLQVSICMLYIILHHSKTSGSGPVTIVIDSMMWKVATMIVVRDELLSIVERSILPGFLSMTNKHELAPPH